MAETMKRAENAAASGAAGRVIQGCAFDNDLKTAARKA